MTIIEAVVLGVVQGVTEFLPISSDGHLALVYRLFGSRPDLSFTVFLHFATLLAIVAYFRRDLWALLSALFSRDKARAAQRRLGWLIAAGTVVSAVIALALKDVVEPASESLLAIGLGFLLTTGALLVAEWVRASRERRGAVKIVEAESLPWLRVALVGIAQGLAVLPGVSRSGSTIAGSMVAGMRREAAARFSFLLGVPIMVLAAADDAVGLLSGAEKLPGLLPSAVGFACAGVAGYAAIWALLALVKRVSLAWFAAYTGLLGCILLAMSIAGG